MSKINIKNLILPSITLGIRPLAVITQLMRNSLIEVMQMDYIRTATAKGLPFKKVIVKHALKNSFNQSKSTFKIVFNSNRYLEKKYNIWKWN